MNPSDYWGLAPFLRASIAGQDLRGLIQALLEQLEVTGQGNANVLMNLSIAAQCMNQFALGLAFQQEALQTQRCYTLPALLQPTRLRLLVLVTEGSIQSSTPLDCLLEESDIELIFYFVLSGDPPLKGLADLPAHDLLFIGICDSDASRALLQSLAVALTHWPRPVLNSPEYLPFTGRDRASHHMQGIPQLRSPPTLRVARSQLALLASEQSQVADLLPGGSFPIILRPVGSQAGLNLEKVDNSRAVAAYLSALDVDDFFLAPFVDYSDAQGQFRKIRIALIAGTPYVCHMAVSSKWMVHYLNAGMYEEAWKREEERRFMEDFAHFSAKHRAAFNAITERMRLDYLVMDCAETRAGELLLFEIDNAGVVHAMDVESLFPYKNGHVEKAKNAFCALLYGLQEKATHEGTGART